MWFCKIFNRNYRIAVQDKQLLHDLDLIVLSAAVGTILFSNSGGAALTGYASAFGAGEFAFGLISALPILGSLIQLYISYLVEKTGKRKTLFLTGGIIQRSLWIVTAFIPYFMPKQFASSRVWVLLTLITLASIAGSFVSVTHTSMIAEVVPMKIRGRYLTIRQRITTLFSLAAGLGAAFILDHAKGYAGYTIVFAVGGICGIADILMYVRFNFPEINRGERRFSIMDGLRECFHTPKTRNFLIFWSVWGFTISLSSTFFNKYAIDVLSLSFIQIILFGQITANVVSILIVPRWGRLIDRYGCVPLMMFTGLVTAAFGLAWLPATPGSVLPLFLFNFFGGMVWCGNDACSVNMQLSHTPDIGRPLALALYAIVTSISAAIAFVSAGAFLELMRPIMATAGLTIFGTPFDHYKLLFVITAILRILGVLIFLPRVWNEKGFTIRQAYAAFFQDTRATFRRLRHTRFTFHRFRR